MSPSLPRNVVNLAAEPSGRCETAADVWPCASDNPGRKPALACADRRIKRRRASGLQCHANVLIWVLALLAVEPSCLRTRAERAVISWASFRGNDSTGTAKEPVVGPSQSALEVCWVSPVPGSGYSSPVADSDTVYVSTAYLGSRGRLTFVAAHWIAVLAIIAAAGFAFSDFTHAPPPTWRAFGVALRLGVLFILAAAGRDLLGCVNDTFRTLIFYVTAATLSLDTARILTHGGRRTQLAIAVASVVVMGVGLLYLQSLPTLRQPRLLFAVCLLPLVPAILCVREALARTGTPAPWHRLALAGVIGAPLGLLAFKAYRTSSSPFWEIQPVRSLEFSGGYIGAVVALLIIALLLYWSAGSHRARQVAGLLLLAWAALLAAPILAAPLVNSSVYLKYQLVRGSLGSPLGLLGLALASGAFLVTGLVPILLRGRALNVRQSGFRNASLCILPVVGGMLPLLGELAGSAGGTVCAVVAFDAPTGKVRWLTEGLLGKAATHASSYNSPATPSPVLTESFVVAYFGEHGAFACDRASGALGWTYSDLDYRSDYGAASSLAGTPSAVVVQSDSDGIDSYVAALSLVNGRPIWRHSRHGEPTWRSPISFHWRGLELICAWAGEFCDFIAADSGELLRRVRGIDCCEGPADPVSSPVFARDMVLFAGTEHLLGVSLPQLFDSAKQEISLNSGASDHGSGQPTLPHVTPAVSVELVGDGPTCSTPAFDGKRVLTVSDLGTVWCICVQDQQALWKTDIGPTKGSPVIADSHAFIVNDQGRLHVFDLAKPDPTPVAVLDLGDGVMASPVISGSHLFVRTKTRLYCLRGTSAAPNTLN